MIEHFAQALHRIEQFARPIRHGNVAPLAVQLEFGFAAAPRDQQMIGIQRRLFAAADRLALAQQAQREKRLQEAQLVLIDADRIERAHVERAHFDVFHAGAMQRLGRPLAGARDALRADETVVLVLDLQDVGVELLILAVDLDAELLVRRIGRADRPRTDRARTRPDC